MKKCQLISWELDQILREYKVVVKNKDNKKLEKISASVISKDKNFINKLSAEDANRIGYMAGINDTLKELNTNAELNMSGSI